ncbi:MAG TPA: alkaline phosphatase family protein [Anaerolineae bacterium]|nr:alkaline phosphatase family protein [Anaerolineae bacterium]
MSPILLVFIDSFPFDYLNHAPFLSSLANSWRVIPGFGYSSTCQVELLSGLTPDSLGYFGEWVYNPADAPFRKWHSPLQTLSVTRHIYYLDRVLHKILQRISGIGIKNIPLSYLSYFSSPYVSVFDKRFPHSSIPNLPRVKGVCSYDYSSLPVEKVDTAVYERAKQCIANIPENHHLFVSMTKLDHVGHWNGVDSPEYRQKVAELDQWVEDLYVRFLKRFPEGELVVISDHGMVNVKQLVTLELEKVFGKVRPDTYTYFLDGTLLRIWSDQPHLINNMVDYLSNLQIGVSLTTNERNAFGLTRPSCGNIIFVLNESVMFVPSFWGGRSSKGMHGYHPLISSQHGILLSSTALFPDFTSIEELRAPQIFQGLHSIMTV